MKKRFKKFSLLLLVTTCIFLHACADKVICDGRVVIHSKNKIKFSKNEKPLLCGDENIKAWKDVPMAQTELTMKEFLKGRGYYDPQFKLIEKDDPKFIKDDSTDSNKVEAQLHIYSGPEYKVSNVVFIDAPIDFYKVKFVGWINKDFVSGTLDEIEAWSLRRLKSIGYACAQVTIKAITDTKVVEVYIKSGEKYLFPEITQDEDNHIKEQVLERFYAFHPGEPFNEDLLTLSSRRSEASSVISHSNFLTSCEDGKLTVTQRVGLGTSRLLEVGAGASTEEYPIVKINWKDSRRDSNASIMTASLYASQLRQSALIGYEWHAFDNNNRWYYEPSLEGNRLDQDNQEFYQFIQWQSFGARRDFKDVHLEFQTGPAGDFEDAQVGPTTGKKAFVLWKSSLSVQSNDYEVFFNEPRKGYRLSIDASSVLYSSVNQLGAHWVSLAGARLWNLRNYNPPKYILGVRGGIKSVFAYKNDDVRGNVPQDYFSWLGGDATVRGFSLFELPKIQIGSLASAFGGVEFRLASAFIEHLDPFAFVDAGFLGNANLQFGGPLYWSPGAGMRYQSFIGVLRATVAHGFVTGTQIEDTEHWQYFVSLGQEF